MFSTLFLNIFISCFFVVLVVPGVHLLPSSSRMRGLSLRQGYGYEAACVCPAPQGSQRQGQEEGVNAGRVVM